MAGYSPWKYGNRKEIEGGEMTQDQFDYLHEGDVIQHVGTGNSYVILTRRLRDGKYSYDAARLIEVTNPIEWEVIKK